MYHKQIEWLEEIVQTESDQDRFNVVKQIIETGGLSEEYIASIINPINYWNQGETIFNVIEKCDIATLNYFIEKGEDVNVKIQDGYTALHWACLKGNDKVVKLLLEKKDKDGNFYFKNVNEKDKQGNTTLHLACLTGQDRIVRLLLGTDRVDIKIKNKIGKTVLDIKGNNSEVNNTFSVYLSNSVIEAVKINWMKRVNYLINKNNTLVNEKDKYGNTPLYYACMNKHYEIVKLLLEKKDKDGNYIANVNEKNNEGYNPLHIACSIGNDKILKLLLKKKDKDGNYIANVNEKDGAGFTALHQACITGNEKVVKLLIGREDIKINEKDGEGFIPLRLACFFRYDNIVKLLLNTGLVNFKIRNKKGQTILDVIKKDNDPVINNIFSVYLSNSVVEAVKINWIDRVNYLISKNNSLVNEKDKYGNTPLYCACMNNNYQIVKLLLEKKNKDGKCIANINEKHKIGYNPLHISCIMGNSKIVKLLLEKKDKTGNHIANINEKGVDRITGLHIACALENDEIVKLLLEIKDKDGNYIANVNEKNIAGYTPLHIVCLKGNYKIVRLLIEKKDKDGNYIANINEKDINGNTPLHFACIIGHDELVKLLIEMKNKNGNYIANVNEKEIQGNTVLHLACDRGNDKIVKLLLEMKDKDGNYIANINNKNGNGNTALHQACMNGKDKIVKFLLEIKDKDGNSIANVNEKGVLGDTALHDACLFGHDNVVKLLLEKKDKDGNYIVNVNAKDGQGYTPLHQACIYKFEKIVKLLLEKKDKNGNYITNVNKKDEYGYTPLHYACVKGHDKLVKLLIEKKDKDGNYIANINEKDKQGYTPLHRACLNGRDKVVELLLEKKDKNGNCIAKVHEKGLQGNTALHDACLKGHEKIVKLLLEKKDKDGNYYFKNVNEKDVQGNTALHLACLTGQDRIVRLLLGTGRVDIKIRNNLGKTVLDIKGNNSKVDKIFSVYLSNSVIEAVKINWIDRVNYLLSKDNTLVNEKDKGNTPLHLAVMNQNPEMIKLLKEYGADANKKNKSKNTSLKIARSMNEKNPSEINKKILDILEGNLSSEKETLLPSTDSRNQSDVEAKSDKEQNQVNNPLTTTQEAVNNKKEDKIDLYMEKIKEIDRVKESLKKNIEHIKKINKYDHMPLIEALVGKKLEVAKLLLTTGGVDLTRKDKYGNSALMYAAKNKYLEIVRGILDKLDGDKSGYILNRNGDGRNSIELAMLKTKGFNKLNSEKKIRELNNRSDIVKLLLKCVSPEEKTEEMFFAITNGLWDMAKIVLEDGADVSKKDGSTPPLILALQMKERNNIEKKLQFIKTLIKTEGIKLDAEDKEYTALSYIVSQASQTGEISSEDKEIVKLLLEKEVNIRGKDRQIVISWAEKANDETINELLKKYNLQSSQVEESEEKSTVKNEEQGQEQEQEQKYKIVYKSGLRDEFDTWGRDNKSVYKDLKKIIFNLSVNPFPKKMKQGGYRLESGEKVELKSERFKGAYSISRGNSDRILYSIEAVNGKKYPHIYNLHGHYRDIEQNYGTLENLRSHCTFDDPIFPENPDNTKEEIEIRNLMLQNI